MKLSERFYNAGISYVNFWGSGVLTKKAISDGIITFGGKQKLYRLVKVHIVGRKKSIEYKN